MSLVETSWGLQALPYLGITSAATDALPQVFADNPMTDFVELPEECRDLKYCNLLCGVVRGALEMVRGQVPERRMHSQETLDQGARYGMRVSCLGRGVRDRRKIQLCQGDELL